MKIYKDYIIDMFLYSEEGEQALELSKFDNIIKHYQDLGFNIELWTEAPPESDEKIDVKVYVFDVTKREISIIEKHLNDELDIIYALVENI